MAHVRLAMASLMIVATVASCGDDKKDASGASTEYCDATFATGAVGEPDVDFETASPAEIVEATKTFAKDTYLPLVNKVRDEAADEIKADVEIGVAAINEVAETGDFEAAVLKPEVEQALDRVHAYDLRECGWTVIDVKGVDYAYEGLPTDIQAGRVSFEFTNAGTELHEMIVVRRNDGVTESLEELLALPEEESNTKVTFVTAAFGEPGATEHSVVDLQEGSYVMICFIPVGTTGPEVQSEGPPHFTAGMVTEFTVK